MIHEDKKYAQLYLRKVQGAEDKGLDWKLSFAQFKKLRQTKRCYYTGIELTHANGKGQEFTDLTLDRVDASKGYEPGNVVACCFEANQLKGTIEAKLELAFQIMDKIQGLRK